jgi:hypothetical protein
MCRQRSGRRGRPAGAGIPGRVPPQRRMSPGVMAAKGISSTESTSICTGPTGYRPPGRTLGRRHSRKDTVTSPDVTASRKSLLNSTQRCYGCRPPDRQCARAVPVDAQITRLCAITDDVDASRSAEQIGGDARRKGRMLITRRSVVAKCCIICWVALRVPPDRRHRLRLMAAGAPGTQAPGTALEGEDEGCDHRCFRLFGTKTLLPETLLLTKLSPKIFRPWT